MKTPHRTITIVAFSLMALNAVLLAYGAAAFDTPRLFVPAALCAFAAVGVAVAWRWYRRNLAELDAAGPELKRELDELRELLRSNKP
jgi:membrane protein implicated in regulation of membrane protease activity